MNGRDEARRSLTSWPTLSEWTRSKQAKRREWMRHQVGWNHMFGGTSSPINKASEELIDRDLDEGDES